MSWICCALAQYAKEVNATKVYESIMEIWWRGYNVKDLQGT